MALSFTSSDPTLSGIDFIKYLRNKPVISRGINEPSTCAMEFAMWGTEFVLPRRGSYFTLGTTADPAFWTGFLIEAPELDYEGKRSEDDQPVWSWKFKGTSDEYILNLAPVGILPVYINQTQGAIIKDLVDRIAPGVFDVSNVYEGQIVHYFFADPTKTFSEIVKEFAEESYSVFWANNFKLYYKRQDSMDNVGVGRHFNGTQDELHHAQIASNISSSSFTFAGWVKRDAITATRNALAGRLFDVNSGWCFFVDETNQLGLYCGDDTTNEFSSIVCPDLSDWAFIAIMRDNSALAGSRVRFYYGTEQSNIALVGTEAMTISPGALGGIGYSFGHCAGNEAISVSAWNGSLDQIGLWNSALTLAELKLASVSGSLVQTGTLVGLAEITGESPEPLRTVGGVLHSVPLTVYGTTTVDGIGGIRGHASSLIINGKTDYSSRVRIASSTNTSPIIITTIAPHGVSDGACISVTEHAGNTAANGNWLVQSTTSTTLELVGSVGNGVGGGTGWAGLHNPHFTPERLSIGPVNDPVINDCIVIGDVEPQGLINEIYVGDGLTNGFPTLSSIYGVDSALLIDEIFTGTVIDSNKWLEVDSVNNVLQVDNGYLNVIGNAADSYAVYLTSKSLVPLQANLRLTHGEFDFVTTTNDGVICALWTQTPTFSSGDVPYLGCIYGIRVTSNGTDIILNPIINGVVQVESYTAKTLTDNKRYIIRTLVNFENVYRRDRQSLFRLINGTIGSYGGNVNTDHPVYRTIITEIDATNGKSTTNQTLWTHSGSNTGLGSSQYYAAYVPVLSNNLHITLSNITISVPMQVSLETLNKDIWQPERNKFSISDGSPVDANLTTLPWQPKIIGPNEIQSYDGMSPVATIITSRQGRIDQGNILGSTLYNPGDATLAFFKDSIKQTANTPPPGQLVHLRYRRAGIALGRAQNSALIATEAAIWGDNGLRTITKKDLSPLPRTSIECEHIASAIVEENSYQHYAGTYTQFSNREFTDSTPIPGGILLFKNMPTTFPSIQAEQITKVETIIENKSQEIFIHQITFGKIDKVKKFLSSLRDGKNIFAPTDTAEVPTAQDLDSAVEDIGILPLLFNPTTLDLTYGSSTTNVLTDTALNIDIDLKLKSWTSVVSDTFITGLTIDNDDPNYFVIEIGQSPPPGGGFEIRYADQGWGDINNKNYLVYDTITDGKTTESSFKIARKLNAVIFVKAFDGNGVYSRYASALRIVFPGIPGNPSSIVAKGGSITHPIFKANLPIGSTGVVSLNSDVFGLVAFYNHQLSLSTNVFTDNRSHVTATSISPYTPIGIDNPGPYNITQADDGFQYEGANVFLPGGATVFDSGFINFETEIPIITGYSLFFVWIRAIGVTEDDGLYIRLNIKDDFLPGQSTQPFGFYSRHDYLLNGDWQPLFTIAQTSGTNGLEGGETILGNYNLVIHNINTTDLTLKICLPMVGTSFHDHSDIVLGASEDGPGLNFIYENVGVIV